MKRYIFILIAVFYALEASGQKQDIISSAGGYYTSSGISMSWTLGETIIPSYGPTNGLILTQGFQSVLRTVAVEENLEPPVKINLYPNPASDYLNISFSEPLDEKADLVILDAQGKLFHKEVIEESTTDFQVSFQEMPSGIYLLKLTKGKQSNVYKVVKL